MNVLLLSLLTFFLPLLFATGILVKTMVSYQKDTTLCLKTLMKIQDEIRRPLESLLALNPKALTLRKKYLAAKARLRIALASKNPAAIAAAEAAVLKVELARAAFDRQQKMLIQEADMLTRQAPAVAKYQMAPMSVAANAPKFIVQPDHPDMAPAYSTPLDFSEMQNLMASWQMDRRVFRCSVTIEKRGMKYRPSITDSGA